MVRSGCLECCLSRYIRFGLDLSEFGLQVTQVLFGQTVTGSKFSIKSKEATQGVWVVTP